MTRQAISNLGLSVGNTPIPALYPGTVDVVSVSGVSAQSSIVAAGTTVVRIVSKVDCHYAIGSNPTATVSDSFLPANVVEHVQICDGQRVALIKTTGATDNNAYVTQAR